MISKNTENISLHRQVFAAQQCSSSGLRDSNHNLASKYSVINTLTHRGRTLCYTPELINNELEHLEKSLGVANILGGQ